MIVAPTEDARLKALGTSVSMVPERFGVDVLWAAKGIGTIGVQRKEFPGDFLASVTDGRLAKEVAQMQALDMRVLVLEGRGNWTVDGELITSWGQPWNRDQHRAYLWSIRSRGIWVEWSDDLEDTIHVVRRLEAWSKKVKHQSLNNRPGPKGLWGRPTTREYQVHFLSGLPDVGAELAARILDTLGMPVQWNVGEEDLLRVHGIGKVKARKLYAALNGGGGGNG